MENKVELEEQNNVEELDEENIFDNMENNNNINENQFLNQEREERYDEQEEEPDDIPDGQNYQNIYDDQNNDVEDDDRLTYTLITLDLGDLIHIFEENNISFVDMLLLSKDDLKELQLKLYQRNRIHNFSVLFNKYAKNYSISEISDFFSFNQKFIFNSSIYDRVISPQNQDEYLNNNENYLQIDNENENKQLNLENDEKLENIYNNGNINDNYDIDKNINNDNINKEQIDFENISYLEYINYMNNEKKEQPKKLLNNNKNSSKKNNNSYNDNNYYLPSDWSNKNQSNIEINK